jgi:hypothetical protein
VLKIHHELRKSEILAPAVAKIIVSGCNSIIKNMSQLKFESTATVLLHMHKCFYEKEPYVSRYTKQF